jgi:hypothetical protein
MRSSRRCTVCATQPVAMSGVDYCFGCWPGGPVVPPPCLRCGATTRYYSNGICARCHRHSGSNGVGVDSCVDCFAWGATRHRKWRCIGCEAWAQSRPVGPCRACQREVPLDKKGYCRLCRRQRTFLVTDHRWGRIEDAVRHGHQLFFADMFTRRGQHTPYRWRREAPVIVPMRPVVHRQLTLFDWPRDMEAGRRRDFREPPDEQLAAFLLHCVDERAASHGWHPSHGRLIRRGVRILLGMQDTPGAPIKGSELMWTSQLGISTPALVDVLSSAGFFEEDREPAIVRWFAAQIADLSADMRRELSVWFDVMRNGSTSTPRRKPRADGTVKNQLRHAFPAIRAWARRCQSLREISREDVRDALPASGAPRVLMLTGLRSIFGILKARGLVFVNPTGWMRARHPEWSVPPAVDLHALQAALDSDNPACAAVAALLAFHAVRIWQLREIRLTDLRDGRLHVSEQTILLAKPVRDRIAAWLDYRNRRWPGTANPHLFISYKSATRTGPVATGWISNQLGIAPQTIRQDRILDEAFATRGDMRQVIDLFGLSAAGAQRYTTIATRAQTSSDQTEER